MVLFFHSVFTFFFLQAPAASTCCKFFQYRRDCPREKITAWDFYRDNEYNSLIIIFIVISLRLRNIKIKKRIQKSSTFFI